MNYYTIAKYVRSAIVYKAMHANEVTINNQHFLPRLSPKVDFALILAPDPDTSIKSIPDSFFLSIMQHIFFSFLIAVGTISNAVSAQACFHLAGRHH